MMRIDEEFFYKCAYSVLLPRQLSFSFTNYLKYSGFRNFFSRMKYITYCVAVILCITACESVVLHGDSLVIVNVNDKSYLTSTQHTVRALYGVYVGKVLAEAEFYGSPNQIWDTIRWPGTPENQFWFYPKGATLNEITAVPSTDSPIPSKNLVELIYVNNVNDTASATPFLIRSTELNKCVQSPGPDYKIAYENCDETNLAQQWRGDKYYEDKERSKTRFSCKFHG